MILVGKVCVIVKSYLQSTGLVRMENEVMKTTRNDSFQVKVTHCIGYRKRMHFVSKVLYLKKGTGCSREVCREKTTCFTA